MTRTRFFSIAAAVLLVAAASNATTIRRLTLDQVRDNAESIFIGHVVSSTVRAVANGELQATDYVVEVSEVLYGRVPATTTVTYLGGPARAIEDVPAPEVDRDYVFFRTEQPGNTTVGWGQGLFRIETASVNGVDRKVLISADGEPLMIANGALSRGRRVAVNGGKVVPLVTTESLVRQRVEGTATNADGSLAPAAKPVARVSSAATTFATLDDLRAFVRMRATSSR